MLLDDVEKISQKHGPGLGFYLTGTGPRDALAGKVEVSDCTVTPKFPFYHIVGFIELRRTIHGVPPRFGFGDDAQLHIWLQEDFPWFWQKSTLGSEKLGFPRKTTRREDWYQDQLHRSRLASSTPMGHPQCVCSRYPTGDAPSPDA